MTNKKVIELTSEEAQTLSEMLTTLSTEGNGVDIWLAPGGVLDVNGADGDANCFLDADEEAHDHINSILKKLMPTEERMVTIPAKNLVGLLNDLGEVERRLESIGIDDGEYYNLISVNVSGLSTFLLDAGFGDLMGAVEIPRDDASIEVLHPIKVAVSETTTLSTPVLLGYQEFTAPELALEFINGLAVEWHKKGQEVAASCDGTWELEGLYNDDDVGGYFTKLDGELMHVVNGGEEIFIAAIDLETLKRLDDAKNFAQ